jgi:glutamate formiminotransferase
LTDFEQTPLHQVLDLVRAQAAVHHVPIAGTQVVGLVPRKAIEQCEHFDENLILEHRLEMWQKN